MSSTAWNLVLAAEQLIASRLVVSPFSILESSALYLDLNLNFKCLNLLISIVDFSFSGGPHAPGFPIRWDTHFKNHYFWDCHNSFHNINRCFGGSYRFCGFEEWSMTHESYPHEESNAATIVTKIKDRKGYLCVATERKKSLSTR